MFFNLPILAEYFVGVDISSTALKEAKNSYRKYDFVYLQQQKSPAAQRLTPRQRNMEEILRKTKRRMVPNTNNCQ